MSTSMPGTVLEANRLAGTRLELLLFRVGDNQIYGINVFKVVEIVPYQSLTRLPGAHALVKGIAKLRGDTISVIDLAAAISNRPLDNPQDAFIIVTEYNRSKHGFLVSAADRIVSTAWDQIIKAPHGIGRGSFLTAVTVVGQQLVEILDVEKVLDQIVHAKTEVSAELSKKALRSTKRVLVVDDSSVARKQIQLALEQVGVECVTVDNGATAIKLLQQLVVDKADVRQHFSMIISDIEMPEMDGYQFTLAVRAMAAFSDIYILLHSSISGEFNSDMVKRTRANRFIQKYCPDDLAEAVLEQIGD